MLSSQDSYSAAFKNYLALKEKAEKELDETEEFLESSPENTNTPIT